MPIPTTSGREGPRQAEIEWIAPADLKPYERNARRHSKKQLRQLADSIKTFGFTAPVLIDAAGMILAGHGRCEAAKLIGLERIPCVRLSSLTPEQKRAYVLADNKLALNATWDDDLLAAELKSLLDCELSFDVSVIGFEPAEIDQLLEIVEPSEAGAPEDDAMPPLEEVAISKAGDLWLLGNHRLYCGDATEAESYARLLDAEQAQMVFTDPPYNVPIAGHVSGLGKVSHREFAMASGEMSREAFTRFLGSVFKLLATHSADGSIHFVCMDWRHIGEMIAAGEEAYSELKNVCVWAKDNGGMGAFYRSRHELVFAFKAGTAPHINNFELGQHGRYRTNVWSYRGVNTFKSGRHDELAMHPTVKPVALVADAIRDVSKRGGIVLDCFGGSGTTLIAAEKTGRRARLIELDAIYVDRAIKRWQLYAKDDAVHAESGLSFDELSSRASELEAAA